MREGREVRLCDKTYPCPCCGFMSFNEGPGSYSICQICFWEDDDAQLRYVDMGGANISLRIAQTNYLEMGACEPRLVEFVREPLPEDHRDPTWRMLNPVTEPFSLPEEDQSYFEVVCSTDPENAHYYWRKS